LSGKYAYWTLRERRRDTYREIRRRHCRDVTSEFEGAQDAISRPRDATEVQGETRDSAKIRYLPPATASNTVICSTLKYEAHAEKSNIEVPEWLLVFLKLPRTLVGHEEPVSYHARATEEINYEAELAAVIGESARHFSPEEALDYVAGDRILNDTSARDLQLGLQVDDDQMLDWFSGRQ